MSILRDVTQERHQAVEALPFVQYLLRGSITQEHYVIYLAEMLEVYRHLEILAALEGLLTSLPELPRVERMTADLAELAPDHAHDVTAATREYLRYLTHLFASARSGDLMAHVYVRHLGDMYGGKLIARVVPGAGRWYEFDNRADLVKRFNSQLHMGLADEALVAFDWFGRIFEDLWRRIHNDVCDSTS